MLTAGSMATCEETFDVEDEYIYVRNVQANVGGEAPSERGHSLLRSPDTVRDGLNRAWGVTIAVGGGILSAIQSIRQAFDSTREVRRDLYDVLEAVAFSPPRLSSGEGFYY